MTAALRIGIPGAAGRMGRMLVREASGGVAGCALAAVSGRPGGAVPEVPAGVKVCDSIEGLAASCDVVVDFTRGGLASLHAEACAAAGVPLVLGTTGLSAAEENAVRQAALRVPVFYAANMSVGVALLAHLVERAAERLKAADFDIEIFEAHHRHKVDAPSGTALMLGRAAAAGRGIAQELPSDGTRAGARAEGSIGYSVFRGGDVVGEHVVTFAGSGERVELAHRATDRAIFARGALRAALWLKPQAPGIYGMNDLLELSA
jgi:4-hydroxy-tetrahydrodipicolinate reductase